MFWARAAGDLGAESPVPRLALNESSDVFLTEIETSVMLTLHIFSPPLAGPRHFCVQRASCLLEARKQAVIAPRCQRNKRSERGLNLQLPLASSTSRLAPASWPRGCHRTPRSGECGAVRFLCRLILMCHRDFLVLVGWEKACVRGKNPSPL